MFIARKIDDLNFRWGRSHLEILKFLASEWTCFVKTLKTEHLPTPLDILKSKITFEKEHDTQDALLTINDEALVLLVNVKEYLWHWQTEQKRFN